MVRRHSWEADNRQKNIYGLASFGIVIIFIVCTLSFFVQTSGNPIEKYMAEKGAKEYLNENYPGLYEQVLTANSGNASMLPDGTWRVSYFARENGEYMLAETTLLQFYIITDKKGNIIKDGYKDYYLTGGSMYDNYRRQFNIILNDFCETYLKESDFFRPLVIESCNSWNTGFTTKGDRYVSYHGEYLDPEKEYDLNSLSSKYGDIDLRLRTESCSMNEYTDFVQKLGQLLDKENISYNTINIYMYAVNGNTSVYKTFLSYKNMHSRNLNETIKVNTEVSERYPQ